MEINLHCYCYSPSVFLSAWRDITLAHGVESLVLCSIFLSQEILRCIDLFFLPVPESYLWTYHTIVNTTIRCSMTSSILFLIAIAHARLVAITKPFQNSSRGSSSNKSKLKFLGYCVPIIILSTIVASTVYLETGKEAFETENGETIFMPVPSAIRLSPIYSILCVGFVNFGLLGVFPLVSLMYCSYHLIQESKKNNDSILSAYPPIVAIRERQRQNLTKSLILMIFVHSTHGLYMDSGPCLGPSAPNPTGEHFSRLFCAGVAKA